MRKIEKKKKRAPWITAIVLASVLVLAVAISLIVYFNVDQDPDENPNESPTPLEGESVYMGSLIAYPTMDEEAIQYISVKNESGTYGVSRPDTNGDFKFWYVDTYGNTTWYNPNVADVDGNFDYKNLYAIEATDGYNSVYKLAYLCMALQLPYVEERIELAELSAAEQEKALDVYGFGAGEYETIVFDYTEKDADGKNVTKRHTIKLGDKTTYGTGYYFMVDDRPYVYAGFSQYFKYAMLGFNSFVSSTLISPGIDTDGVFAGFITSDYKQWSLETHKTEGALVADGSKVLVYADSLTPLRYNDKPALGTDVVNGYAHTGYRLTEFDLSDYKGNADYLRLINAISGKAVGDYSDNELIFTLTSRTLPLAFGDKASLAYEYTVTAIEAVITDTFEYTAAGTPVGDNDLIKVSYKLKIDGKAVSNSTLHAVIDLSDPLIPASFVNSVRGESVGSLSDSDSLSFTVNYTKENAPKNEIKIVISEISAIYDKDGKSAETVTDTSVVTYRYFVQINGKNDTERPYTATINLGGEENMDTTQLKALLVGKRVSSGLNLAFKGSVEYNETVYEFISYRVNKIDSYITKTMKSAFRFQNKSNRDPYYGESIYENSIDNKYAIYGISNSVCRQIVELFSGISTDTSSAPEGLKGTETLEVGITPELMNKYGLYKHEIYFETPRYISYINDSEGNETDDFDWYEEIGFTLYISDENDDGTRYIASELYDIIAVIDGEKFGFLDYEFVDFWARRELMLVDVSYIDDIRIEMNMEDLKGTYHLDLTHTPVYWTANGDRYTAQTKPDDLNADLADEINVIVTPSGECTPNKLLEYMAEKGYSAEGGSGCVSITELYAALQNGGVPKYVGREHIGIDDFKQLLQIIYFTHYTGSVEAESQADIIANSPMIFRMAFSLDEHIAPNTSPYYYVYEFYRYDDSRVLVNLYQATYNSESGEYTAVTTPVSDFYVTTFAMKKIISNFTNLFNLIDVDKETPYN